MYDIVIKLIKKHKTFDAFALAKSMNIKVVVTDLGSEVRGFYQYFKRGKMIYLNERLTELEMKKVLSHEIGHSVLHKGMNRIFMDKHTLNNPGKYENQADLFSAFLLISDEDIRKCIDYGYPLDNVFKSTGLRHEIIEKRINDYKKRYM